jgi:predicted CoA-binding protein
MGDWRSHLCESDEDIRRIVRQSKRIAVLGIKTEAQSGQPAFSVPAYMQRVGADIIPVPVYYPEVNDILGAKVYRRLVDVPGGIDLVDVFRRPADIPQHLDDLLKSRPKAVWFQLGIRHDEVAQVLAKAGIDVVSDRCLMVDHRRFA